MPYIKPIERSKLNPIIDSAVAAVSISFSDFNEGQFNYLVSSICKKLFESNKKYSTANKLIGVLECIKIELYRKNIAEYENLKEAENGSI